MTRSLEQKMDVPRDSAGAAAQQSSTSGPSSDGNKMAQIVFSDLQQRALKEMVQQAVAKAVESALSSQLNTAVNRAAKAIDNFSQASARKVEEHCAQTREKFETSVRQDFISRMQSDVAAAEEQLRTQIENSLAKTRQAAELLESAATEIPTRLADAQIDLRSSAHELEAQFSVRLLETFDRAASNFRDEATRVSGEQLSSWSQNMAATTEDAEARLKERAAQADAQLETAAARSVANVQTVAEDGITRVASELREAATSSLASLAAQTRAEWDARQRACQEEVARLGKQEVEQFRQRIEAILNSTMTAAISTANEHSRILFDSLLRGTVEQLREDNKADASAVSVP